MAELDPSHTGRSSIVVSKVTGTAVHNTAGEKLGSVYDVMTEKASGRAAYAIDEQQGGYVEIDRALLEGAPSYRASYGREVNDHYGVSDPV